MTANSQTSKIAEAVPWGTQDNFVRAVMGSISQPVIMTVPELGINQIVDGGVRYNRSPDVD